MLLTAAALASIVTVAVAADEHGAPAQPPMAMHMHMAQPWTALMTESQEVRPDGMCVASGSACFTLTPDGEGLCYSLEVDKLACPTSAQIHMGLAHQDGPVVATLYCGDEPTPWTWSQVWDPSGYRILAHGTIRARDLRGPLAGQPITALLALFHSHDAYVNVHTPWHCDGAIRGQIW
jgi:hypothetical protein